MSLINAYKNNYVTTTITQGGAVFQYVLQMVVLCATKSFVLYLLCRVISVVAQLVITEFVAKKKYFEITSSRHKKTLDKETKTVLIKNIKAMFMHKIGTVLVNTVDSVVISIFLGVVVLGAYSNYITILTAVTSILTIAFGSLTSVIGHLCVEQDKNTAKEYCEIFHTVNFMLGVVFFLGYYAIIDNIIACLFSINLIIERSITFVITLNGFVQFMRQSVLTFRTATGTFYNDRWKPLVEGIMNIILSIVFVKTMGVSGVIVATIATNLLICHIVEPFVLYKNAFSVSPKRYYCKNYFMITIFTILMFVMELCSVNISNQWLQMIFNGFISVAISALVFILLLKIDRRILKIFKRGNSNEPTN